LLGSRGALDNAARKGDRAGVVDAAYAVPELLEPGIVRLLARNPSPYTFTGTCSFLVGEREVAVIDPGPELSEHIEALLSAIAGRPVAAILCTHTHRDHSPAARPLAERTGAPIVGCARLSLDGVGEGMEAAFDHDYAPDRVLADGEAIRVDGRELVAIATPGHASNHLCFADEGAGVLFSGDHVMGWSTSVVIPPDGNMADYMRSLDKLRGRSDRVYYPAHGPAVRNPQQLVRSMLAHRQQRERQILNIVTAAAQTVEGIVTAAYPGLDPRLQSAAGASVLAHLIDLEQRGRVERNGAQWQPVA
jgi:glyoxylase-like metal-dependent hydrolase (beta-lactamase superfamily II)